MRPVESFADALAARVLLCDGAMGTLAQATGFRPDGPGVELAAIAPELVAALHQRYLDAGADVIQTHTFGASRLRLAQHGLGPRVRELNLAAARVATAARDTAARPVWVAGSVSPAGSLRPGNRSPGDAAAALREQVDALVAGGVDLVLLETFRHAGELVDALAAVREVTDLPVVAQATFVDEDGTPVTARGESPAEVLERLTGDLVAVGTNCTLGPQGLLRVVREMAGHTDLPLVAQPNAGLPHVVSDRRVHFAADAEHFARYVARYVAAGARLVGGCCGTTPEHTAAAWSALQTLTDPEADEPATEDAPDPAPITVGTAPHHVPAASASGAGAVARWLRGEAGFLVAAEIAGRGGVDEHRARAHAAVGDGASVLWVSRPRAGRYATTPAGLAVDLQDAVDVDVALTVTSWDASRMALQADLLGLHALGVRTLVCETGNPPVDAEAPVVDGVWEVDATGLLRLAAGLGRGVDGDGQDLGAATPFRLGARFTPGADDLVREARRAGEKVAAGAEFLVSRPVYELDRVREVLAGLDRPVPVLLSITPLADFAHAEYVRHEVPDTVVPDAVLDRMRRSRDPRRTGLEIAEELVAAAAALGGPIGGVVVRWSGPAGAPGSASSALRSASALRSTPPGRVRTPRRPR